MANKQKSVGKAAPAPKAGHKELKKRFIALLIGIVVYRVGCFVPIPFLDPQRLADLFSGPHNSILGMFNMFSGGALMRLTVFALGIMPYISASIIIQMFTAVSPKLDQLRKEGESGRRKINQYTRYGTLILAIFQSLGLAKWLVGEHIAIQSGPLFYVVATLTLITGTMFIMWMGEQMTERGIGNGISMIIFAGIVARLPSAVGGLLQSYREGQIVGLIMLLIIVVVLGVTAFVVFVERGQRKIEIHYAQRQQGKKLYAAKNSHLPLKINMAGVIPPIFASSILLLPATLASWFSQSSGFHWLGPVGLSLAPGQPLYMILLAVAIVFFSFFYTALVFNPRDTADNLKRSGAFIPGIRPGEQTARYIDSVMTRLTVVGALYLVLVALMPEFLIMAWHVPFYFGGTSLLIVVVVVMDLISQIQAHLMSHQYDALLKKSKFKM